MKAYRLTPGAGLSGLERIDLPTPQPGPHEVVVRMRAAALNYRDLMFARGNYLNRGGSRWSRWATVPARWSPRVRP